jgi:hypothetical protein
VGDFSSAAESKFSQWIDSARMHPGRDTDGNERLTSLIGAVLIVLLAALGITILRVGQLMWPHVFLGLLLLGPVAVKMASTGYRFVRYYTNDPAYRSKGPPELVMRATAPLVVVTTVIVFVSGVLLLFEGPRSRSQWLPLHKVSFIVWGVFFALHVLWHLPGMLGALRREGTGASPGAAGRWITLAGAVVAGLIVAIVLIPQFGPWTAHAAALRRDH